MVTIGSWASSQLDQWPQELLLLWDSEWLRALQFDGGIVSPSVFCTGIMVPQQVHCFEMILRPLFRGRQVC